MVFSNASRTSVGACCTAAMKASSSVLSSSVTSSSSNSCSAWSTVRVWKVSGLVTISIICSLVIWLVIVMGDESCSSDTVVSGVYSCGCVVFVGCSVSEGTVSGTDVAGMVVEAGSTESSGMVVDVV